MCVVCVAAEKTPPSAPNTINYSHTLSTPSVPLSLFHTHTQMETHDDIKHSVTLPDWAVTHLLWATESEVVMKCSVWGSIQAAWIKKPINSLLKFHDAAKAPAAEDHGERMRTKTLLLLY